MKFYIFPVAIILMVSAFVQPGDSRIPDDEVKGSKHLNNRFHSPIEIRKRQMLREEFLSKMYGNEKPSFFGRPFGRGSGRDNFGQKQRFDRMGRNGGSSMDELFRYPPSPGSRRYQQRRPVMYPRELGPKPPQQLFLEEIIIIRRIPVVLAKILGIKTDNRPGSGKYPRRPGSPGPLGPIPFPPPQPLAPGPSASRPPPPPFQGNRNPVPEIEEIYPADQATKGQPLLPPQQQQSSKKPTDNLDSTTKDVDLEKWEDEEEEEEITPAFKDNAKNAGSDKAESSESDNEKEEEESLEPVARSSSLDSDKQMNQSKDQGPNIKQEVKELKVKNDNDNKRQETENDETENEI